MDASQTSDLIVKAIDQVRENVTKRIEEYAIERDWQKLRPHEMGDIAAQEAAVELTQLAIELRGE